MSPTKTSNQSVLKNQFSKNQFKKISPKKIRFQKISFQKSVLTQEISSKKIIFQSPKKISHQDYFLKDQSSKDNL